MKKTSIENTTLELVPLKNIQCHASAKKAFHESLNFNFQVKDIDISNDFLEYINLFHPLNVIRIDNEYQFFSGWLWLSKFDQKFEMTNVIVHNKKLSPKKIQTLSWQYLLMIQCQNLDRQTALGQFLKTFEKISNKSIKNTLFGQISGKTLRKKISNITNESREVINHQLKRIN